MRWGLKPWRLTGSPAFIWWPMRDAIILGVGICLGIGGTLIVIFFFREWGSTDDGPP